MCRNSLEPLARPPGPHAAVERNCVHDCLRVGMLFTGSKHTWENTRIKNNSKDKQLDSKNRDVRKVKGAARAGRSGGLIHARQASPFCAARMMSNSRAIQLLQAKTSFPDSHGTVWEPSVSLTRLSFMYVFLAIPSHCGFSLHPQPVRSLSAIAEEFFISLKL